jgi:hypothetical protein
MISYSQWSEAKRLKKQPVGQCFPYANNLLRTMLDDDVIPESQIKLCHGVVIEPFAADPNPHVHAWIEARGLVYDWQLSIVGKNGMAIDTYYELFKPQNVKKYSPHEALTTFVRHRHHGPWH